MLNRAMTVLLCLILAACGKPPAPVETTTAPEPNATTVEPMDETPVEGDWIVGQLSAEMPHLNPITSTDAYSFTINGHIFESLIDFDKHTYEPKPKLAESWEISDDKLIYTFHLRKDVKFSDGVGLTAHDVKFTFDTIMNPDVDAAHLRHMYQDVVSVEVPDDYTVRFVCNKPYFRHIIVLGALDVIPEHIYGTGDFNNHPNNRHPIGSGPYVFESWDTGLQISLSRNEDYWGKKPYTLKRVYKIIIDPNAALQVLEKGEMDTMDSPTPEMWVTRMAKPEFEAKFYKFKYYAPRYSYIAWNSLKPQFEDKRVRRAMTMLFDRELILETIMHGLGRVVTGPQFVDSPEYNNAVEPWPYDPKEARRLLDEAGWTDTDNDGIRDKDGIPFTFEFIYGVGRPTTEQMLTVYQEALTRAGIKVILKPLEWATLLETMTKGDYDAYTAGWGLPLYPDPYSTWHSSQTGVGGFNRVNFKNAEADAIIEKARTEFNRDERIKLYHRLHEILHEEQPYTFLYCSNELAVVDKRFRGIVVYPRGLDSDEWWVPKALQKYN